MTPWWEDCKVLDIVDKCKTSKKTDRPSFDPKGLLQHLQEKAKSCEIHYGVIIYLHQLYKVPYGIDVGHRALYNQSDRKYKEALAAANESSKERAARIDLQLKAAAVAEKKAGDEGTAGSTQVPTKSSGKKKARLQSLLKEIKEVYDVDEEELDDETKEMLKALLAQIIAKEPSKSSTTTK